MNITIFQRIIHSKAAITLTSVLILYTLLGFMNRTVHLLPVSGNASSISNWAVFSSGRLSFSDIKLSKVWQFVRDSMAIDNPDGQFDLHTAYEIDLGQTEPSIRLNNLEFNLAELAIENIFI